MTQKPTHDQLPLTGNELSTDVALHRLVDDENLYVFGHGTATQSNALGSISEGLRLKSAHLWSTVLGIESTVDDPGAYEKDKALLEGWPHHNTRFVVMLGVERLSPEDIPHRLYLQSIVQDRKDIDIPETNDTYKSPYVIKSRFVAGYFDLDADIFVGNPDFDPHYDTGLLETTADDDILRERNSISMLELMGQAAVGEIHHELIPQQPPDNAPDVW